MRMVLLLVGLSLALRLSCVAWSGLRLLPHSDTLWHHQYGVHLARTGELGDGKELSRAARTPGYPLFLAAVYRVAGENPRAVGYVQAFLGALVTWLLILLGTELAGRRVGLLAGAFHAVSAYSILYTPFLLQEVLALPLLVGLLLTRAREKGAATGVLLAAAVMVRPAALYLAPGLLLPWLRTRWRSALVASGLVALVSGAWVARNAALGFGPVFTSWDGINLYMGNHDGSTGGWNREIEREARALPGTARQQEEARRREAVHWIVTHPAGYAAACWARAVKLFGVCADVPLRQMLPLSWLWWIRALSAPVQWAAWIWGMAHWRRYRLVLGPAVTYSALVILSFGAVRFRELLGPMVLVLMAAMFDALYLRLRARGARGAVESEQVAARA